MTDSDIEIDMPSVVPMLSYEDVATSADWLSEAFGFREAGRWSDSAGTVTHVNMVVGDGVVMLGFPSASYESPRRHAETCATARTLRETPYIVDGVLVYVTDIESHYQQAVESGARVLSGLEMNEAVGQSQYRVEDLEGHRWMFAERTG
jgi:PhnB protein